MPSVQPCALVLAAVNCRKERDESMRSKAGKIRPFSRGRAASVVVRSGLGSRVSRPVASPSPSVWSGVSMSSDRPLSCVCARRRSKISSFFTFLGKTEVRAARAEGEREPLSRACGRLSSRVSARCGTGCASPVF